jgi:predicted helicase
MRYNLLKTFDKIYILDLHGNAKKKETASDGSEDKNVFDIQQGVSINIFVKTPKTNTQSAQIYHCDLFGRREEKYNYLLNNNLQSVKWNKLPIVAPNYFFVPKNFSLKEEYEKGFKIIELFTKNSVGIVTGNDELNISFSVDEQIQKLNDLNHLKEDQWRTKYQRAQDSTSWKYVPARQEIVSNIDKNKIISISYRPFDMRYTYYTGKSGGLYSRPLFQVMQHFIKGKNLGLICKRGFVEDASPIFITKNITEFRYWSRAGMQGGDYVFPLYLYQENFGKTKKVTNMKEEIVNKIAATIGVDKVNELQIFDYIYAVLHSSLYRDRYKEFLKIDFPIIPYPDNLKQFERLADLGEKLRKLHLMENVKIQQNIANFPIAGTNEIDKPRYSNNKVFINKDQYFDNVPLSAWEFYIGGYQPAQKWLKDRKDKKLDFNDVQHYQKIITVLCETKQIMKEINTNLKKLK